MFAIQTLTWAVTLLSTFSSAATLPTEETSLVARQATAGDCKDVRIFIARGWKEPYPGRQGKLAGAICYDLPSCDYEDIVYESLEDSNFCKSVTQGKRNGLKQMKAYASRCPNAKLVLTGYSQGANVAGDMLGGGSGYFGAGDSKCFIQASKALDPATSPGKQIGAALLFGDVRHVADQSYNVLNGSVASSGDPRFPRSLARMNKFAGVLRSYCDGADPLCAATGPGEKTIENHLNYFDRYSDDAGGWVKYMLGY